MMLKKILTLAAFAGLLLIVFTAAPASAINEGAAPEVAYQLLADRTVVLPKQTDTWVTFNLRDPYNYDHVTLDMDFDGFLDQQGIDKLYRDLRLDNGVYDPAKINELLKTRRNQEKLPKPSGVLMPVLNFEGHIRSFHYDDGNRSGVDLQTEIGKGSWLVRLINNSPSTYTAHLALHGYYNNSVHP